MPLRSRGLDNLHQSWVTFVAEVERVNEARGAGCAVGRVGNNSDAIGYPYLRHRSRGRQRRCDRCHTTVGGDTECQSVHIHARPRSSPSGQSATASGPCSSTRIARIRRRASSRRASSRASLASNRSSRAVPLYPRFCALRSRCRLILWSVGSSLGTVATVLDERAGNLRRQHDRGRLGTMMGTHDAQVMARHRQ